MSHSVSDRFLRVATGTAAVTAVGVGVGILTSRPTISVSASVLGLGAVLVVAAVAVWQVAISWERGVLLVVFLIPLEGLPVPGPFSTFVRVAFILAVVAFVADVIRSPGLQQRARSLMHMTSANLWLVFAIWSAASVAWATDLANFSDRIQTVLGVLALMYLVALVRVANRVWIWRSLLAGLIVAATTSQLLPANADFLSRRSRFSVGGLDPNELATIVAVLLAAVVVGEILGKRSSLQTGIAAGALILLVGGTGSRTGIVLVAAVLLMGLVAMFSGRWRGQRPRIAMNVILGIAVAVSAVFLVVTFAAVDGQISSVVVKAEQRYTQAIEGQDSAFEERTVRWALASSLWADNLTAGLGLGGFDSAAYESGLRSGRDPSSGGVAHNAFLAVGAELGIVGFVLFVSAIVSTAAVAWRCVLYPSMRLFLLIGLLAVGLAALALDLQDSKIVFVLLGSMMSLGVEASVTAAGGNRTVMGRLDTGSAASSR